VKIYIYEFPGSYLGGHAVVYAKSEEQAFLMLKEEMKSVFPEQAPKIKNVFLLDSDPAIIYYDDGDY